MIKKLLYYFIKTIELFQYTLLSLIASLIISELLEKFINKYLIDKQNNFINKVIFALISIYFLIIGLYIIQKYIAKLPFLLNPITKLIGYKPSLNNEKMLGIMTGLNWIYFSGQNLFVKVLNDIYQDINIYFNL